MTCRTCPFACTAESEQVQNLACLPTPQEIRRIKRDAGKNWPCHMDESRICAGFVADCRERGVDPKVGELGSYTRWYHEGVS